MAAGQLEIRVARLEEQHKSNKTARKLQAREYARRLKDLNGEAKRLRDIQASYVPRETFEAYVASQAEVQAGLAKALEDTRERLERSTKETTSRIEGSLGELRQDQAQRIGRQLGTSQLLAGAVAFIGVALAIATLILTHH